MAIDTDGNLWIAIFGGDRVIKIDPRKPETLLESIQLPAHQVIFTLYIRFFHLICL